MIRFGTVASRAMFGAVVLSSLLVASCEYKRAVNMPMRAKLTTSLESPTFEPIDRSFSEGAGRQDSHALLKLVAEQTEATTESRKIVRNGSLELLVSDVGQAAGKVRAIAEGLSGYVEKSTQTNIGGHTAVITVRVPSGSLDRAMSEIEHMALSVDRENVEARDVTRDYVDLDARLRNAEAEEERYLKILKRAATVKDTLDGAEKLSGVRGQIEQLQGEMKYLTTQIDMSSLEISLRGEAGATVLGIQWRPLRQAKVALGEMISGLADWADSVIAFFINLPLIVVWVITIIILVAIAVRILRFCWKKLWPKTAWRLPWSRPRSNEQASQD
jgi:Domain of unknown function (DUF4349)